MVQHTKERICSEINARTPHPHGETVMPLTVGSQYHFCIPHSPEEAHGMLQN